LANTNKNSELTFRHSEFF